jgi:diaminobutyrate-2-oxoglutarate transaminase
MQIRLFKSLKPLHQLEKDFLIGETDGARKILEALLNSDYSGKSAGKMPTICITDWSDVGTKSEQENIAEYFNKLGYKTFLADPRELMYKDEALRFKDDKIHIVHRRVIMSELAERINEVQPLVKAVRDGVASMVNPFSSALGSNKVILAILSEEKYHPLLKSDTVAVMKKYLPWTRLFHIKTDNALLRKIVENKDSYVLKKGISYGGSAVFVGQEVNKEQWKALTEKILNIPEERWIVQKYVTPPRAIYPVIREGDMKFQEFIFNINPFIIEGEYVNGMARLNLPDRQVINVARGGFQVPMIQINEK